MRLSLLSLLSVIVLGVLLVSGASLADREDHDARRAELLVIGSFGCGDFLQQDGRRESNRCFEFQGWEGVGRVASAPGPFEENRPLCLFFEPQGNLGETCRGLTQEVRSVAQALGCATGPVVALEDPGVFFDSVVQFTCSGKRDQVVGTMAEFSRAFLEFPL